MLTDQQLAMPVIEQAARIVRAELEKLAAAGTSDAIALALKAKKIRAIRGEGQNCAIAVDLKMVLDEALGKGHGIRVYVPGSSEVNLRRGSDNSYCAVPVRGIDNPINHFIHDFDGHKYPELTAY